MTFSRLDRWTFRVGGVFMLYAGLAPSPAAQAFRDGMGRMFGNLTFGLLEPSYQAIGAVALVMMASLFIVISFVGPDDADEPPEFGPGDRWEQKNL